MPIPSLITDLSTTVGSNSPAGSDNVFPDLDNYLRALSAFLASIRDNSGNGWVSPYVTPAVLTTTLASPPAIGGTTRAAGNFTTVSALATSGDANVSCSAVSGNQADFRVNTAGSLRWFWGKNSSPESTGNAGSDFFIAACNDAGSFLYIPIAITRSTGVVTFSARIKMTPRTVASLTAASTAGAGAKDFVSDANATTFASIVAGGGGNNIPVYSDGTNWRIG